MSTKLQTTLGKVDPSKLAKEKSHGNKPFDFVVFLFEFLSLNLIATDCITIQDKFLMRETIIHFVFAQ